MPRAGWTKPVSERRLSDLVSVGAGQPAHGPTLRIIGTQAGETDVAGSAAKEAVTLTQDGSPVEVCVLDARDEAFLGSADSVAVIPRVPLRAGATMALVSSIRGVPVASTFTTSGFPPGTPIDLTEACPEATTPFGDVPPGTTAARAIRCMNDLGVIIGRSATVFEPSSGLTRGQMASLIERLLAITEDPPFSGGAPDAFDDDNGSVHEANLNRLAARGIYLGRSHRVADAGGPLTRAELSSFLNRATPAMGIADPPAPIPDAFTDDNGSVHEATINRLTALGIAHRITETGFHPNAAIARADAAQFLARAWAHHAATGAASG